MDLPKESKVNVDVSFTFYFHLCNSTTLLSRMAKPVNEIHSTVQQTYIYRKKNVVHSINIFVKTPLTLADKDKTEK